MFLQSLGKYLSALVGTMIGLDRPLSTFRGLSLQASSNHLQIAGGAYYATRNAHPRARPLKSETK